LFGVVRLEPPTPDATTATTGLAVALPAATRLAATALGCLADLAFAAETELPLLLDSRLPFFRLRTQR
jgi:hypothetical protein